VTQGVGKIRGMGEPKPKAKRTRKRRPTHEAQLDRCAKGQCCAHKLLNDLTPQQMLILWNGFTGPQNAYPAQMSKDVAVLIERLQPLAERAVRDLGCPHD